METASDSGDFFAHSQSHAVLSKISRHWEKGARLLGVSPELRSHHLTDGDNAMHTLPIHMHIVTFMRTYAQIHIHTETHTYRLICTHSYWHTLVYA